jgi:hypothetical protein
MKHAELLQPIQFAKYRTHLYIYNFRIKFLVVQHPLMVGYKNRSMSTVNMTIILDSVQCVEYF